MIAILVVFTLSFFQTPATPPQKSESINQMQAQLEKLKITESQLLTEFNRVQGELNSVRQKIANLESQIAGEQQKSKGAVTATLTADVNVFSEPSWASNVIDQLKKDSLVQICGYEQRENAYKIRFNDKFGYIGEAWVIETPPLAVLTRLIHE